MAGASSSSSLQANLIVEERNELMIPRKTGGQSFLRTAHFLRPSAASIDGPGFTPSFPPTLDSDERKLTQMYLRVEVEFLGWNHPQRNWQTWIEQMHALHHLTWRETGIYEAIMSSKYMRHINEDLILRFLIYWLSRFVFPKIAKDSIGETVIPVSIHLCRGTRIALAPAVLASMYKDLRLLKEVDS